MIVRSAKKKKVIQGKPREGENIDPRKPGQGHKTQKKTKGQARKEKEREGNGDTVNENRG